MRKPQTIEYLYLDFDGFFASVQQQADRSLRGRPVGIVPFENAAHTCVIACSKEAKRQGVKNVMSLAEAKSICPDLILVPQNPALYRQAHNALVREISAVLPVEAIKSIDELTCRLDGHDRAYPEKVSAKIKGRILHHIGTSITCSIGFAANRQLAKMACKVNKPDGLTIWHPQQMPGPLLKEALSDVPGIGKRMLVRLNKAHIYSMKELLALCPAKMRAIWGSVTGERLWYALHGYCLHAMPSKRGMFGHSRVLPPAWRSLDYAQDCSRLLLVKAARRMRREGFCAGQLALSLQGARGVDKAAPRRWGDQIALESAFDDRSCLQGLDQLWEAMKERLFAHQKIKQVGVSLFDLTYLTERQFDLFTQMDDKRVKWEELSRLTDELNDRYGRTILSLGPWRPPPGGYAGGKISYTRVPAFEDFW